MPNNPTLVRTFEAAAQLTPGHIALMGSDGRLAEGTADAVTIVGVTQSCTAAAPYMATIAMGGIVEVMSDGAGAVDEGDKLAAGTSGRAKTRNPATGTNARQVLGIALTPAAATANLYVECLLTLANYVGA